MGESVAACEKEVLMYRTEAMQACLAKLYAHIFKFLSETMEWYLKKSGKRFLDSFKGDFYKDFEAKIKIIMAISAGIKREADLGIMGQAHSILRVTEDSKHILQQLSPQLNDLRVRQNSIERDAAEVKQYLEKLSQAVENDRRHRMQLIEDEPQRTEALVAAVTSRVLSSDNSNMLLNSEGIGFNVGRAVQPSPRIRAHSSGLLSIKIGPEG